MITLSQPVVVQPHETLPSGRYVAGAPMPHMVKFLASDGDRLDAVRDVELDGAGLAQRGILLDVVVQRHFESVHISRCGTGLVLNGTQNCNFEASHIEACGTGIRLNHGAGGNVFERCDANGCGQALAIAQDDSLDEVPAGEPGVAVYAYGPSNNQFTGVIFERGTDAVRPNVSVGAGMGNSFYACGFSAAPGMVPLFVGRLGQAPFSAAHTFDCCDLFAYVGAWLVEAWNVRMRSWTINVNGAAAAFSITRTRVLSDGLHHVAAGPLVQNNTPTPPWGWYEPALAQIA